MAQIPVLPKATALSALSAHLGPTHAVNYVMPADARDLLGSASGAGAARLDPPSHGQRAHSVEPLSASPMGSIACRAHRPGRRGDGRTRQRRVSPRRSSVPLDPEPARLGLFAVPWSKGPFGRACAAPRLCAAIVRRPPSGRGRSPRPPAGRLCAAAARAKAGPRSSGSPAQWCKAEASPRA